MDRHQDSTVVSGRPPSPLSENSGALEGENGDVELNEKDDLVEEQESLLPDSSTPPATEDDARRFSFTYGDDASPTYPDHIAMSRPDEHRSDENETGRYQRLPTDHNARENVCSPVVSPSGVYQSSSGTIGSPGTHPSVHPEGNASSFRDLSWSTMFDHFLNTRKNPREFVDKCSITYLGESFPLAIVLEDLKEGGRPKLHHPGPPFPEREPQRGPQNRLQPEHLLPEDLEYLRIKGVFDFPSKPHLDALMTVFLEQVYPLYPIVNQLEIVQQHANGELPLILLHSICFIAATFCPLSLIYQAGFPSRRDARFSYYRKVKVLFDSGYEINKIVILQSALLMSFWGGGPNNYWNFYSWMSTAVTVAEGMGMHRSTATTNMKVQDKSLLRRLWWILVVRDSACSALVGRPFRIDINQSDTEMLTTQDFAHDSADPNFLHTPEHQMFALYQIEIARLSLILRDVVISRFYPGSPQVHPVELHTRLKDWRDQLSPSLAWRDESVDPLNPYSTTLSVQYNHHLIMIYLGHVPNDSPSRQHEEYEQGNITTSAAYDIAAVASTVVTKSSVLRMPHELFHGIFLAQAVFYTQLRSSNKLLSQLGRSELVKCQMVLRDSCESWDPSPWIMQLFDNLSTRLFEKVPAPNEQEGNPYTIPSRSDPPGISSMITSDPDAGVFNGLFGYDPWQNGPMLSSLFNLPPDILLPQ
ncbi:hypothetical protein ABOM_010235 [Aspergillus bombycis]|uniref:Xylanolytic transcriptional activator regulatory domain-containing protein n=1 Tax=Aspergillus bombycis TaxID=109264 RepID=A0A1F7ZNL7_9EURO|nr:hypothetical protein ABOM_010235 [Aspergillus bombycis]OGM41050.1 hypothetical protein ABOM_010235 [Aspergillus bombycis]